MGLFKIVILLVFALLLVAIAAPEPLRAIPLTGAAVGPQVCSGSYTLAPGETPAIIATRCNLSVSEIVNVNPGITDMKNVPAGTTIVLPGPGKFPGSGPAPIPATGGESSTSVQSVPSINNQNAANPQQVRPSTSVQYTVVAGDTLSIIANRYGSSLNAILAANPTITNPDLIHPGQVLWIP